MGFFGKDSASKRAIKRRGSPGKRCYAIGDVHGRLDLLKDLLIQIESHQRQKPAPEVAVVLLGDVIDRGPDSRGVIERLMRPLPFAARLICLKGNHEDILVRGLGGEPELLPDWLEHGGFECAASYGVERGLLTGQSIEVLEHNLASAIPAQHLRFLASFADSARFGDYLLVHAGVRPGIAFQSQTPEDMKWIRQPFLDSPVEHGFMVVHGHSMSLEVEERPNRIGIDTGAYKNGVLTAIWLEDEKRGFLQARDTPVS